LSIPFRAEWSNHSAKYPSLNFGIDHFKGKNKDMFTQVQYGAKEYDEALALRSEVLRAPLGLELGREELDDEKDSFHLVSWRDNAIVACLVLMPQSKKQLKMRQLAVRENCRGEGVGHALVSYAESFALDHSYKEIVLHARETALGFYEKMGYEVEGECFIEVTIPHFFMRKNLLKGEGMQLKTPLGNGH
jgi:predicted GNAT family N-acyltransferase